MPYEESLTATGVIRAAMEAHKAWSAGGEMPAMFAPSTKPGRRLAATTAAAPEPKETTYKVAPGETAITRPGGAVYIPRMLDRHHDVAAVRQARTAGLPMLLRGEPGTGKTAMIEAAFGEDLYTLSGSGDTEVADFLGSWVQNADGTFSFAEGPLLLAMKEGKPFFIDEVALIDPKAMSCVYSAMDGRGEVHVTTNPTIGTVKAQPGFYVCAAYNPNAPGARVSEALLSRFIIQIEVTTDYALCRTLGVNSKFVSAARNLDMKRQNGEISWAPQLRECLGFKAVEETFGLDMAVANALAQAPEEDRTVVADVLTRQFGNASVMLTLGAQA